MSKVCKSCGNNLYGNKIKCPFCGAPISYSNRRSAPAPQKMPGSQPYRHTKQRLSFVEVIILLAISFFIPPLGLIFFFGFSKEQSAFAFLSLLFGFFGFLQYM